MASMNITAVTTFHIELPDVKPEDLQGEAVRFLRQHQETGGFEHIGTAGTIEITDIRLGTYTGRVADFVVG